MNNKMELHILNLVQAGMEKLDEAYMAATWTTRDRLYKRAEAYNYAAEVLHSGFDTDIAHNFKENEAWVAFRKRLRAGV